MTGQAWLTLHYMVRCGASNRPLWSCGVVRLQGRHYYMTIILTTDLSQCARKPCCQSWPCARLEVPEVAEVLEVLGVLGASTPGCCCSSPTDPCHRQPSDLSSASHLKLKIFQSLKHFYQGRKIFMFPPDRRPVYCVADS